MDDKLREIIESKKDDREIAEFAGITLTLAEYDFLIEQAERVQELEETNKKNYWIAADFKFENLQLEQQNKRYREALEEISQKRMAYADMAGVLRIARKALEDGNSD